MLGDDVSLANWLFGQSGTTTDAGICTNSQVIGYCPVDGVVAYSTTILGAVCMSTCSVDCTDQTRADALAAFAHIMGWSNALCNDFKMAIKPTERKQHHLCDNNNHKFIERMCDGACPYATDSEDDSRRLTEFSGSLKFREGLRKLGHRQVTAPRRLSDSRIWQDVYLSWDKAAYATPNTANNTAECAVANQVTPGEVSLAQTGGLWDWLEYHQPASAMSHSVSCKFPFRFITIPGESCVADGGTGHLDTVNHPNPDVVNNRCFTKCSTPRDDGARVWNDKDKDADGNYLWCSGSKNYFKN